MDNSARSERTRLAVMDAALAIIARDGASRLTLDAIARECKISKGALTHQFHSKEAVLKALLERQVRHFDAFFDRYMAEQTDGRAQPRLAAQIATAREALASPHSVAFAMLGAVAQEPGLLAVTRDVDASKLDAIRAEAADPDLAVLRASAATGLVLSALLGLSPLQPEERERLFERLLDDSRWPSQAA